MHQPSIISQADQIYAYYVVYNWNAVESDDDDKIKKLSGSASCCIYYYEPEIRSKDQLAEMRESIRLQLEEVYGSSYGSVTVMITWFIRLPGDDK